MLSSLSLSLSFLPVMLVNKKPGEIPWRWPILWPWLIPLLAHKEQEEEDA